MRTIGHCGVRALPSPSGAWAGWMMWGVALAIAGVGCGPRTTVARDDLARQFMRRCLPPVEVPMDPVSSGGRGEDVAERALHAPSGWVQDEGLEAARGDAAGRALLRVVALQADLMATQSWLDCLDDGLEDLQREMESGRERFEFRLTMASIAVGAVGGLVAGGLELRRPAAERAAAWTAVSAGTASAGMGALALVPTRAHVNVHWHANPLRDVWTGERRAFPSSVWALLTDPNDEGRRAIDAVRDEWDAWLDEEPAERTRREALFFGEGGLHRLDDLALRERMVDRLETLVDQMHRVLRATLHAADDEHSVDP